MKTTVDLPEALVKQVKLRALLAGQKLKDAVTDLIRKGLAATDKAHHAATSNPLVTKNNETGLPMIHCPHAAKPEEELTPERVAAILLEQEVGWHRVSGR